MPIKKQLSHQSIKCDKCNKSIEYGDNCLYSWDFHEIYCENCAKKKVIKNR